MHEYLVVSLVLMLGYFGPSIFGTRYMHWYVVLGHLLLVLGNLDTFNSPVRHMIMFLLKLHSLYVTCFFLDESLNLAIFSENRPYIGRISYFWLLN